MNMEHHKIAEWCRTAVALLRAAGLSSNSAEGTIEAVERHSDSRGIYEIAEDLAEGISHLPPKIRHIAQDALIKEHGFGYDYFIDAKMKQVRAVVARGRIRNEREYRVFLDIAGDITFNASLRDDLRRVIAEYEAVLAAPGSSSAPWIKRSSRLKSP